MAYTETALYVDSVSYAAVTQWAATHAYSVGNVVRQLAAPAQLNERCFICIVAGTSLSTEPAWQAARGVKTTESGGPTWMECTGLPALNGDNVSTNAWRASAGAIALGWIIKNVANTHYFICTTAGTGGTGAEPSWNTTTGATTTDGSVVWTCIGATSSFTTKLAFPHSRMTVPLNNSPNWVLNSGMTVWVGDDHSETQSLTATYNAAAGFACSIICFDHTAALPPGSANLKTTAQITVGNTFGFLGVSGSLYYVYGLQFINPMAINAGVANFNARFTLERCAFSITGTNASVWFFGDNQNTGFPLLLKDCTFSIANFSSGQSFRFAGGTIKVENGVFTAVLGTAGLPLLSTTSANPQLTLEGCDFSGVASSSFLMGVANGTWVVKDCVIPAGMAIASGPSGTDSLTLDLNRADSGGTAYRNERWRLEGVLTTSTSIVRSGGAVDGATPISHQIATNANTNNTYRIFNALPFATWNSVIGSNRNITLYGIVNDTRVPNNDEFWFDCEYLGSAASPKGSYARGSKSNVLAAGSALTADTSAWDSAATVRANSTAYAVGNVIKTASNPGRIFFCTASSGNSAASEPGGYATAVDGGVVTDGSCTFRAGCRFSQTLTLSSPQPQLPGYLYAYPKFSRASMTYLLDPKIVLT